MLKHEKEQLKCKLNFTQLTIGCCLDSCMNKLNLAATNPEKYSIKDGDVIELIKSVEMAQKNMEELREAVSMLKNLCKLIN